MTRRMLIAICTAMIVMAAGCRRNEPPAPETGASATGVETTTVAGAPRNAADMNVEVTLPLRPNAVTKCVAGAGGVEKKTFAPGEPIELTLAIAEAPEGLKVAARLIDKDDQVVAHVTEPAAGKKTATVVVRRKLDRGTYRLEGYWGGNIVCEQTIEVATPRR